MKKKEKFVVQINKYVSVYSSFTKIIFTHNIRMFLNLIRFPDFESKTLSKVERNIKLLITLPYNILTNSKGNAATDFGLPVTTPEIEVGIRESF